MKHIFLALTFLICISSTAKSKRWSFASDNDIWTIEAGYTNFLPYQLNDYFVARGASNTFTPFRTYGIGHTGSLAIARGGMVDGGFAFHYFERQTINVDSSKLKVGGWELMTSIYGFDLLRKIRAVDFVIAPGVFWGSIKMRKYFAGGNVKQFEMFKNPFIAPMLRAELRFQLGPVSVGGRWSYRYDISKSQWKKGSSETLPGYQAREMQYIVYLGYVFNWKDR